MNSSRFIRFDEKLKVVKALFAGSFNEWQSIERFVDVFEDLGVEVTKKTEAFGFATQATYEGISYRIFKYGTVDGPQLPEILEITKDETKISFNLCTSEIVVYRNKRQHERITNIQEHKGNVDRLSLFCTKHAGDGRLSEEKEFEIPLRDGIFQLEFQGQLKTKQEAVALAQRSLSVKVLEVLKGSL